MSADGMDIRIRVSRDGDASNCIDADILLQILGNLQKLTCLVASDHLGGLTGTSRIPPDIQKQYALVCDIPAPGSYIIPVTLAYARGNIYGEQIVAKVGDIFDAIQSGAMDRIHTIVHIPDIARKVMESARSMLPQTGSNWRMGIAVSNRSEQTFDGTYRARVKTAISANREESVQTVTGFLHEMDFARRRIVIMHPSTQRQLECSYDESVEVDLVERRMDLVQVTGTVILDAEGEVLRIVNVDTISALDLSDFCVNHIPYKGHCLQFVTPLALTPTLSESRQLICLEEKSLRIDVFAQTREMLEQELFEQIGMLWREYALEDDDRLSPSAIALKKNLLAKIKEVML